MGSDEKSQLSQMSMTKCAIVGPHIRSHHVLWLVQREPDPVPRLPLHRLGSQARECTMHSHGWESQSDDWTSQTGKHSMLPWLGAMII